MSRPRQWIKLGTSSSSGSTLAASYQQLRIRRGAPPSGTWYGERGEYRELEMPGTERSLVLTENVAPFAGEWAPCHCCGRSYLAINMVRFEHHPDDALCVGCVTWLHDRSRPIIRKLYPIWQMPARIRAWIGPAR